MSQVAFGARMAGRGGATGWTRVALTAVAVGLGVAFLLLAASVPNLLEARQARVDARVDYSEAPPRGDDTMLIARFDTRFHDAPIRGRLLQPDGPAAPVPPGVATLPKPGQMVASPALSKLLSSPSGASLRPRLGYRVIGVIGDDGLTGPGELAFYAGTGELGEQPGVWRMAAFGTKGSAGDRLPPQLMLLVVVSFVVLLLPVAVFMASAVRFGGESRDRRLAALRLVGADRPMMRRFATGEALAGAILGVAAGAAFFLAGRQAAGAITLWDISVFPEDIRPSPRLVVLIVLMLLALTVTVTLGSLRKVAIEPLGVMRRTGQERRRLWWRILLPAVGFALFAPLIVGRGDVAGGLTTIQVAAGAILVLVGVAALLPWLVATTVRPFGAGSVSWQLAMRRIQADSASSARLVSAVAVAVAGAIALQTFVAGTQSAFAKETGADPAVAQLTASLDQRTPLARAKEITGRFTATPGVRSVLSVYSRSVQLVGTDTATALVVGDCASLRELARISRCGSRDVFIVENDGTTARPGQRIDADGVPWTVPTTAMLVKGKTAPDGSQWSDALLATPDAVGASVSDKLALELYIGVDRSQPDVLEFVRNTAASVTPLMEVSGVETTAVDKTLTKVLSGIFVGTAGALLLIGMSMLATVLDQLRERRKLLAALVALGARRSTMTLSSLWQMAVPVALALVPAVFVGTGLGVVLLAMLGYPIRISPLGVLVTVSAGAGLVVLVTVLSLPLQWNLMRPGQLREE